MRPLDNSTRKLDLSRFFNDIGVGLRTTGEIIAMEPSLLGHRTGQTDLEAVGKPAMGRQSK